METTSYFEAQQEAKQLQSRIASFFDTFTIGTLLNTSGIRKLKGTTPLVIFQAIFMLPFQGANFYRGIVLNDNVAFGKDAAYELLASPKYNWRAFMLKLSALVCRYYDALTNDDRVKVLIADDSVYDRGRSKKVELLARIFDHNSRRYLNGFKLLQLGWSDGASFVPLDFALRSSVAKKNRLQESTKELDKRCCGSKRRKEATTKTPAVLEEMVKRVLARGVRADYLLLDSWFCFSGLIARLSKDIPVICMAKDLKSVLYCHKNVHVRLSELYKRLRKKPGLAKVLASTVVEMKGGTAVKVVFVRHRNTRKWLALLSTDLELADEEIVRIYGKRWDIEVFFKMAKQHLNLEREVQLRDYDGLIGHTTIVMTRYIFLAFEQRHYDDPRTLGSLFHACCDEVADISLLESMKRLLALVLDAIRSTGEFSEQIISSMIDVIMGTAVDILNSHQACTAVLKGKTAK
ncbi:transposase [Desulfogranum marinum]|uniref:IS4 family transposase n=1 Tax=Desulfogranum marinum TaxID=453220 RepID=UPI0029C77BC8|nr:transposase [Desulfogranum marinum]